MIVCTILAYYCSRSSNEFGSDLEENFFVRVIIFLHRILCTINVHMFFIKHMKIHYFGDTPPPQPGHELSTSEIHFRSSERLAFYLLGRLGKSLEVKLQYTEFPCTYRTYISISFTMGRHKSI